MYSTYYYFKADQDAGLFRPIVGHMRRALYEIHEHDYNTVSNATG